MFSGTTKPFKSKVVTLIMFPEFRPDNFLDTFCAFIRNNLHKQKLLSFILVSHNFLYEPY